MPVAVLCGLVVSAGVIGVDLQRNAQGKAVPFDSGSLAEITFLTDTPEW